MVKAKYMFLIMLTFTQPEALRKIRRFEGIDIKFLVGRALSWKGISIQNWRPV